jgi:long-chain acyl-CoA synthetase
MHRIWLESYPAGVPADVDVYAYASLNELLQRASERFGAQMAFLCLGGTLSYAEVDTLSRQFAVSLQRHLSLARGERIAIMLPNLLQYPGALFGALRAGLVVVNVNPLYTADELAYQIADSGATTIVVLENFAHIVQQALDRTRLRWGGQ